MPRLTLLLFLALHAFLPSAMALQVVSSNGKLVLKAANCGEIEAQLNQLREWEHPVLRAGCSPRATESARGCSAEITDCVPQYVRNLNGVKPSVKPPFSGPNCFNLVMVSTGALPYLVETSSSEMSLYKKSPLCSRLNQADVKKPGDVGSILSDLAEIHGFVYVTDQLAFSKNGQSGEEGYQLTSLRETLNRYGVGTKASNDPDSECYRSKEPECQTTVRVEYYRCKSMDQYLRETSSRPIQKTLAHATHLMDQIDCRISKAAFDLQAANPMARGQIAQVADVLEKYLQEDVPRALNLTPQLTPEDVFALGILKLRINSLSNNLSQSPIVNADQNRLSTRLVRAAQKLGEVPAR